MLNIAPELKELYKQDSVPKAYDIYFPALDLHITNDRLVDGSFELTESLCSSNDLVFGSCEAAEVRFTVADIEQDLTGQWFTIHQIIDDYDPVPFGIFKVGSCKKQSDKRFKDIIAYDALANIDVDVAGWYNSMFLSGNEKYTLKQFRESLLDYLGIEYEDETLPNDGMIVEKTTDVTQISGREVLQKCVELNGAFGHINRYGKFEHVILEPGYGLYPSEDLYPSNGLYPVDENNTTYINENLIDETVANSLRRRPVEFEEYTVQEIDKLIIRTEEDDIGSIVGTGSNTYIIQDNFLVYGKSASELEQITRNAYGNMAKRPYRPYKAEIVGLPYIEVGDTLLFTGDNPITGYVLQRTLFGIQALKDEIITQGKEKREQNFNINTEIIRQKGRIARIKKDVEGVRIEVEDLAAETASKFEQTATQISAEVSRAIGKEQELSGRIDVMAGQVVLKVDANGNVAAVELDADPSEGTSVKIKADNIQLEGLVTANGYFKILPDGSMEATNGKFSGSVYSYGNEGSMEITGARLVARNLNNEVIAWINPSGEIHGIEVRTVEITCTKLNGSTPITSDNVSSQSVYKATYADKATSADYATEAVHASFADLANRTPVADTARGISYSGDPTNRNGVYLSANYNFRPANDNYSSCGTSEGKWSSVWVYNGNIQSSDIREKKEILPLEDDERFLKFAKMIVPYTYKMLNGTSGRKHIGFIAQYVEDAMKECGISDMEFAGLIKAPVYAKKLKDSNGNELNEYDTTSEIIDYTYHLRYEEFIPLIFLWLRSLNID